MRSLSSFEPLFNQRFQYPYVFLNNEPFSLEFKQEITSYITSFRNSPPEIYFYQIAVSDWTYPSFINQTRAAEIRRGNSHHKSLFGEKSGMESYHFMIRYFSGPFFKHPELQKYDYYWRGLNFIQSSVEPYVDFYCTLEYDPFLFMQEKGLKYGFNMMVPEFMATVKSLYPTIDSYFKLHGIAPKPLWEMFTTRKTWSPPTYNGIHFWSNFEIADFRFFRSKQYMDLFDYLDRAGGFFYERWGDAPVHSLAVAAFLDKSQVHYFGGLFLVYAADIGYRHDSAIFCPIPPSKCGLKCNCSPDHFAYMQIGSSLYSTYWNKMNHWHNLAVQ